MESVAACIQEQNNDLFRLSMLEEGCSAQLIVKFTKT